MPPSALLVCSYRKEVKYMHNNDMARMNTLSHESERGFI